jgi:uncharacterized membrane protein
LQVCLQAGSIAALQSFSVAQTAGAHLPKILASADVANIVTIAKTQLIIKTFFIKFSFSFISTLDHPASRYL